MADFNGDGKLDLAVANSGSTNVSVLLGKGDGTFRAAVNYGTGLSPRSIALADFDADGKLDIVVANSSSTSVSVLLGKGDGTFKPATFFAAGGPAAFVAVGDVNRDGKPDLVVANPSAVTTNGTFSVLLGKGDGTFGSPTSMDAGNYPTSIALGDFNGDGNLDLALANRPVDTAFNAHGYVSVFLGKGDGTFQAPTAYEAGWKPRRILGGDFNGDGKLDLAVASYGAGFNPGTATDDTGDFEIRFGNGDGTFWGGISSQAGQGSECRGGW